MEKMNTLPHETIHIMPRCVMHLYGHQKKVVPLLKPSIFMDLSNGIKFRNCTYWLTNDTWNHYLPYWVSNHHIGNEKLVLLDHAEIGL
jgi:hypothetical protein